MHTPGPWTARGENILATGVDVALVRNIDDTRATLDANARLIAAAPALLEALEEGSRMVTEALADDNVSEPHFDDLLNWVYAADAAIAKAKLVPAQKGE